MTDLEAMAAAGALADSSKLILWLERHEHIRFTFADPQGSPADKVIELLDAFVPKPAEPSKRTEVTDASIPEDPPADRPGRPLPIV